MFHFNIGDLNMKEKEFDPIVIDDSEFDKFAKEADALPTQDSGE